MICCDTCLDWYHGKCVGITKKMGKDMEEAGNEWRCPKCKKSEEDAVIKEKKDELNKKLKDREEEKKKQKPVKKSFPPLKRSESSKSLEGEKVIKIVENSTIRVEKRISLGSSGFNLENKRI
jgi:hypothetical protein